MNPRTDHIPHVPGVYLMRDAQANILYIGKAIDLKKRVSSYFQKQDLPPKIASMIHLIRQIDYIPASSERDALVLEQKLIRKFQPLYNTMWRDDKSYPFIKLSTDEDVPRLFLTRTVKKGKGKYFGPYPNVTSIKQLLKMLWRKKTIPLRPCRFPFVRKDIEADGGLEKTNPALYKKVRTCIYLHTKECPAPCVGRISIDDYRNIAKEAEQFFKGDFGPLEQSLEIEMKSASKSMDYETAARIRNQIQAIGHVAEKILLYETDEESVQGQVTKSRALTELQKELGLADPPIRIETFDISNIQGTEPVASMAVFLNGRPAKSEYRKFKIRTVTGQDDFAMMQEVIGRRYGRLAREDGPWPSLILIDGGKGQLSSAQEALHAVKGVPRIPMASLAKENEEIFLPEISEPIRLPKDSPALHILQAARDEAHRFAVSFHRQRRNKLILRGSSDKR